MRTILAAMLSAALAACTHAGTPVSARTDAIAPSVLREDFRALYDGLQRAHYNLYANMSKPEMDRQFARMLDELDRPLTPVEAQIRFQRFAALGRVAHARLDGPSAGFAAYRAEGGLAFPLFVRVVSGRLYVAQNLSGVSGIAPGDEIVAIDGVASRVWLERLGRHVSADNAYLAASLIELDFPQLMWRERGPATSFRVRLAGAAADIDVQARNRTDMRAAAAAASPGLSIDPTAREARMLDGGVAYLRPGLFMNVTSDDPYDTTSFHQFIDAAFAHFLDARASTLLIDLRDNPGGDNSFSDHMIAWFADEPFRFASDFRIRVSAETIASNAARLPNEAPGGVSHQMAAAYAGAAPGDIVHFPIALSQPRADRRFAGRVYVLINRRSYSNAVNVAAIVQDYGFGRILGEATADNATTLGAMESFTLPHTGFVVGFPKAHIIRPNGDETVQGVTPDVAIETPILESADDTVLQSALQIVRARG